jgi:hypothetical protein
VLTRDPAVEGAIGMGLRYEGIRWPDSPQQRLHLRQRAVRRQTDIETGWLESVWAAVVFFLEGTGLAS